MPAPARQNMVGVFPPQLLSCRIPDSRLGRKRAAILRRLPRSSFRRSSLSGRCTLLLSFSPSTDAVVAGGHTLTAEYAFRGSPMEGTYNAELLDAREPAHKKQACDNSHVNGHNNGVSGMHYVQPLSLRVKKLAPGAVLPSRGSALAAGYDLSSAYDAVVPARGKALIKTELSIAIPEGTYARVAPRSGLAWKHSIDVGAGVIDADYRGPLGVILFNHAETDFSIKAGDRIAQLILERIVTPEVVEVDDLDTTARGEGGFGSTGMAATPIVVVG